MSARVAATDWSRTALGPQERWPESLRVAVGICLSSRFPMFVWWGPELVNIYNDAYAPILGKRHPHALGRPAREVWSEIWSVVGPQAAAVLERGEATWNERVLLVMERNGYPEETYFTWSYSPIPDGAGGIGGVFCACTEETPYVLAERERAHLLAQVETERARLGQAFAQSPAFIAAVRGPDHVYELVNRPYSALMGGRALVGKPVREAVPELVEQGFVELLDRVYRTGEPFVGTGARIMLQRAPGGPLEEAFLDFVYQPMRGPDGAVEGVVGHGIDVTVRARSERRDAFLLALDATLRPLADPVEIATRAAQLLGEHLDVDRSVYAEVEADEDAFDVVGHHERGVSRMAGRHRLSELGDELVRRMRDDRPLVVVDTHEPTSRDLPAHCSAWVRAMVWVPLHETGRLVAAMGIHQRSPRTWSPAEIELVRHVANRCWEAIARARVERALASEKAVLELIATGAPLRDVLEAIVVSIEGQSVDGMRCAISMLSEGSQPELLVAPPGLGDADAHRRTPILGADGRVVGTVSIYARDEDGGALAPSAHDLELVRSATHLAGIVIERHRIDSRLRDSLDAERRARSQAEHASRMKDEFLATLSHELRTPLNAIVGWSSRLAIDSTDAALVVRGLEVIERNAAAQARIVGDLLDMSAILSGKVRLDLRSVELAEVVRAAVDAARPTADAKQIRLDVELEAPEGATVRGDAARLLQMMGNLLNNAIKFSPPGGWARVTLASSEERAEVRVRDGGEGIDPDFLPCVFDRFRQADASTTRAHGGLGLGLSIVEQLALLHGGSVRAESDGLGCGATFVVELPRSAPMPDEPACGGARASLDPGEDLSGLHVLVVDDDDDSRDLVARVLEDAGATITAAASARDALARVEAKRFDVLVSDLAMPVVDGYGLLRRVRWLGAERGFSLPAIALTAYAHAEDRVKALRAGFQAHVAKPIDAGALVALVASVGRQRPRASSA